MRKWARLALKGNPTVLLLLFSPEVHVMTPLGEELRAAHALFASQKAGQSFLGYLSAQKQRLLGERGQMRVHRPELVDAHGYDTKYAMHMLRLGIQGVEYMQSGAITLPIPEPEREWLRGVRRGEVGLNDVLTRVGELELELRDLMNRDRCLRSRSTTKSTSCLFRPISGTGRQSRRRLRSSDAGLRGRDFHPTVQP